VKKTIPLQTRVDRASLYSSKKKIKLKVEIRNGWMPAGHRAWWTGGGLGSHYKYLTIFGNLKHMIRTTVINVMIVVIPSTP
jgi:hypothetical protein